MSDALDRACAEMDVRAREVLQRLAERDRARGWPTFPIAWPARSPQMEAADYWRDPAPSQEAADG